MNESSLSLSDAWCSDFLFLIVTPLFHIRSVNVMHSALIRNKELESAHSILVIQVGLSS
jgi:hypothetical protein